jgi:hypothetical protein
MPLPESFLDSMKIAVLGKTLNGHDVRTGRLDCEHRARLDRGAVDKNRTGTAVTALAPDVGSGQVQRFPQEMDQERSRIDFAVDGSTIDRH